LNTSPKHVKLQIEIARDSIEIYQSIVVIGYCDDNITDMTVALDEIRLGIVFINYLRVEFTAIRHYR
jgi:hypothetical protein